jgi:hypothetical protein
MRAARVDRNQREIVAGLKKIGASVLLLHTVGQGCPDVLVGFRGRNVLLEIKDGGKIASAQKLTDAQQLFVASWRGQHAVVNSVAAAVQVVLGVTNGAANK